MFYLPSFFLYKNPLKYRLEQRTVSVLLVIYTETSLFTFQYILIGFIERERERGSRRKETSM